MIQHTALHEKTVQAIARGEVGKQKRPRRKPGPRLPSWYFRASPVALREAKRRADGDVSRLRFNPQDGSILVVNS